ncbi:hypothetical protein OEW28_06215 [Defluviimonas sp. WL0002]|uniref:Uncharacterized protein n=1 Tax=Albidovulum marisflavi TaxID=2984159 RepID=A0ABT2ZAP5_9RHOB|nr:hypothetical protein [Defluviimonas sp. WL0002]MCV2868220.1 hypothetical protein [Defluviimonas sp. WL0002]
MSARPLLVLLLLAAPAQAETLKGKSYIIELSSSQYASGYGEYILPPLASVLDRSGMRARNGPGADYVVNVVTDSDVGRWVGTGETKTWTYTISAMVGLSPESHVIPLDGTPVLGVRAVLETPNPDRQDEWNCLITMAARTVLEKAGDRGTSRVDGRPCLRR